MLAHLKTTLSSISYFSNSHWRPFIDNWKKLCMCRHDHKANQDGMFPLGGWRHYCCILVDILRSQGYAHNRFLTSHPKDQWLYHLWSLKIVKDDIKSPQNWLEIFHVAFEASCIFSTWHLWKCSWCTGLSSSPDLRSTRLLLCKAVQGFCCCARLHPHCT